MGGLSMTREEAIIEAGIEYSIQNNPYCIGGDNFYEKARELNRNKSFEAGVIWADKNPKSPWISVKDDLPCNHKELISSDKSSENLTVTEYVVAAIYGYKILSRMYELDGKWYWENDEPTHWFSIPEPPK